MEKGRTPSWYVSLIPLAVLVAALAIVIRVFDGDALGGPGQVALLLASGVTAAIAMIFYKTPWKAIEEAIDKNVLSIIQPVFILVIIGAISGSWMISGVVPMLICYGLNVISPGIFLFAACVICALVSLVTGSSWTTIATLGVALMGIGTALGFSPGWTAGAIISGAYFGDKISPLSDTTVLAASMSGTPLFRHIRYMLITTVPSIVIALAVFLAVSLCHDAPSAGQTMEFTAALKSSFNITPWLLVVPALTAFMVARRIPALITLFLSALSAGAVALIAQPEIIHNIATGGSETFQGLSFMNGFKGIFTVYCTDTAVDTGNAALNDLVATTGMRGMLDTIFLILCACAFGAVLTASGMVSSLTRALAKCIRGRASMATATSLTGVTANMLTGDQYLSIILTSSLYKDMYDGLGYEGCQLSRTVEDSTTVTSVLVPWNTCGMTQATVLRVATLEYLPYCIFNLLSPLMTIFITTIGYKLARKSNAE